MARISKKRTAKRAIAIIVDGKDEKWYINKVKSHYECSAIKSIKVKPELPERKKVQELFDYAKMKFDEDFTDVILIIDLDEPLKNSNEYERFKELYGKYLLARDNKLNGRQKAKYNWMKNMLVIINNPCLEYWYLLHYRKTTKHFADFSSLCPELRKIPELAQYEKSEAYYNNHPDIYERLDKNSALINARKNAVLFNLNTCKNQGGSEMNLLFDLFDTL